MNDAPTSKADERAAVFLTCDAEDAVTNWNAAVAAATNRETLAGERFGALLADERAADLLDAARRNGDASLDAAFAGTPGTQYALQASRLADGSVAVHGSPEGAPAAVEASWVDRMTDAFLAVDEDWRLTYVNERARAVLATAMGADYTREEMTGRDLWEAVPGAVGTRFYDEYQAAMASQEPAFFEEYYEPLDAYLEVRAFPSDSGLSVYFRDVTERRERLATLETRERVLRELYEVTSTGDRTFDERVETLLDIGADALGVEYGTLSRISGENYVFEHVHAPADADLAAGDVVPLKATSCERAAATEETLVLADMTAEAPDIAARAGNVELGISCYLGAPVVVEGDVYGTFCFYDQEPRAEPFDDWEVTVVDLMAQWVSNELTDRRIRERLQRQNDRLEDFASIVSHDLRNPLNVLDGSLGLARETGDDEHFDRSRQAVDRMERLVEDLLSLARTGDSVSDPEPTDLAALAAESWETVDTADASLAVETTATVRADRSRLQQLLANLYRNAIEHAGRAVAVTVGDTEDGFYVADDGPGVPPGDRETVFEHGHTTSEDGTGFGLGIVANVAEAHGWTVALTESESGGARFELSGVEFAAEV